MAPGKHILHVGSRGLVIELRDQILRLNGYEVISTTVIDEALLLFAGRGFDLVLVDVEGQGRVPQAERLCEEVRAMVPRQAVAFVCNHRVSIESDCPDEIIHAEFDPVAFVAGVRHILE